MNQPSREDDLKDMFVVLDPPPGGLLRHRARRDAPRRRRARWLIAEVTLAAAVVAVAVFALRGPPVPQSPSPPSPMAPTVAVAAPVAPDLLADRDVTALHPAWIGLGRVTPPAEPLRLASELAGALASRRVAVADDNVVFYMLDPIEQVPADRPE